MITFFSFIEPIFRWLWNCRVLLLFQNQRNHRQGFSESHVISWTTYKKLLKMKYSKILISNMTEKNSVWYNPQITTGERWFVTVQPKWLFPRIIFDYSKYQKKNQWSCLEEEYCGRHKLTHVRMEFPWNSSQDQQAIEWCVCVYAGTLCKMET